MTKEEIKSSISMFDLASRYGLKPNRKGFCMCPFHKDKHPSMKIYKDGYYCFACGKGGDIFNFVRSMENISFKEAFKLLGGSMDRRAENDWKRKRAMLEQKEKNIKAKLDALCVERRYFFLVSEKIEGYIGTLLPFTDEMVRASNLKTDADLYVFNLDQDIDEYQKRLDEIYEK